MPDTEVLVREYWSWITAENPAPEAEQVMRSAGPTSVPIGDGQVRPLEPFPSRRGMQRRWVVAAAAAAVTFILVGGVMVLLSRTGSHSPVATASRMDSLSSLTWSRVWNDEAVFGAARHQFMYSVTVGGPGVVAVGSVEEDANVNSAVWTSVDGLTWSQVPHDETVFGGTEMFSVTVGGPGLVAVGSESRFIEGSDNAYGAAAVWTSVDGLTWSRVPHDEALFGGAVMRGLTAGGPGLVAVGGVERGDDANAAVWTSVDGLTWSRVLHDEAVFGGVGHQAMDSVTVGGPGLVAVGGGAGEMTVDEGAVDWTPTAAVWTSVDGLTWSRVPHDEAVFGGTHLRGQGMNSVTAGGPGLVAVGIVGLGTDDSSGGRGHDAAVWTSGDGLTWSRVPHEVELFGGRRNQRMNSVTATEAGLIAVGSDGGYYGTRPNAVVWTSVDGLAWSRVPHDEAVFGGSQMDSVTVASWGLVAVGDGSLENKGADDREEAIASGHTVSVWVAEMEGP